MNEKFEVGDMVYVKAHMRRTKKGQTNVRAHTRKLKTLPAHDKDKWIAKYGADILSDFKPDTWVEGFEHAKLSEDDVFDMVEGLVNSKRFSKSEILNLLKSDEDVMLSVDEDTLKDMVDSAFGIVEHLSDVDYCKRFNIRVPFGSPRWIYVEEDKIKRKLRRGGLSESEIARLQTKFHELTGNKITKKGRVML